MKKQRLVSEFNYEFNLLGITTSSKDYKLAWAINKYLHLSISREPDHQVLIQNNNYEFTYFFDEPEPEVRLRLFANKSNDRGSGDKAILVPEAAHFDFILMREGDSQSFSVNSLQKLLKEVPLIEYLSPLEVQKLKYKEHFIF